MWAPFASGGAACLFSFLQRCDRASYFDKNFNSEVLQEKSVGVALASRNQIVPEVLYTKEESKIPVSSIHCSI
jgi:hypothetical protein